MIIKCEGVLIGDLEETYQGYEIYITPNPDYWRGGFEWSICKNADNLDNGLAFSVADALIEAQQSITQLIQIP